MKTPFFKKPKVIISVSVIIALSIILGILLKPKAQEAPDVIWREYPVSLGNITASFDGIGKLTLTGVGHSFDTTVTLDQVYIKAGQWVNEGDRLASYNKKKLEEQLNELNLSLAKAERALEDAGNNRTSQQLQFENGSNEAAQTAENQYSSKKREIENAIVTLETSIRKLNDRITALIQKISLAEQSTDGNVDDSSPELKALKQKEVELKAKLTKLQNNSQINNAQGQINALEAQLSSLQNQLTDVQRQIAALTDPSDQLEVLKKQRDLLLQQIADINGQIYNLQNTAYNASAIADIQNQLADLQSQITLLSTKQGAISSLKKEMEQAEGDLETSQGQLSVQRALLEDLEKSWTAQMKQDSQNNAIQGKIHDLTMKSLYNACENAQVEVEKIKTNISDMQELLKAPELTAKISGVVTEVNFKAGEEVPAGQSVVVIGVDGEKQIKVQIPQEDINRVSLNQIVEMRFPAYPDQVLTGVVTEKNSTPITGSDKVTYEVTIRMDATELELLGGMTCSVKFIVKRVEKVLSLTNKAIRLEDGQQKVTVKLPDGTREDRTIKTGFSDGRVSEITDGLQNGDIVVLAG